MIAANSLKILVIYNNDFSDASFNSSEHEQDSEPPGTAIDTSADGHHLKTSFAESEIFNGDFARANVMSVAYSIWGALKDLSLTDINVVPITGLKELSTLLNQNNYDLVVNLCES
ncbi:MAG: hypothetical protein HQK51_12725 [Oligoflexia bacterium]|nr:hypothetical protein [Oligoflexia bacterium]